MIAIISDIHGNFPALRAVMDEIDSIGCEKIISLGDVVGYYCQINECIELLREKGVANIMGNHDYYMVNNQPCVRSNAANEALKYQRSHIKTENLQWLEGSVERIEFDRASFVHGGWNDPLEEYVTEVNQAYFANKTATHFFSGHTHIQSLNTWGRISHCNPGSVGQPRDGNPKAAFAVFDGANVFLKRVEYDIDKIATAMEQCGFDRYYWEGLYTGRRIGAGKIKRGQNQGAGEKA